MGRSRVTDGATGAASGSPPTGDATPSNGIWYTVRRGDTLSHIAARHGLANWRTIYNATPENDEFRRTHPDPNLIFPGDRVFVPNPRQKQETVPTTTRTRFRVRGTGVRLCFIFDNGDGNPNNDRVLTYLCVSNLVTSDKLPNGFGPDPDGSSDPDHFKIEIEDRNERSNTIPANKVTVEVLKPVASGAGSGGGTSGTPTGGSSGTGSTPTGGSGTGSTPTGGSSGTPADGAATPTPAGSAGYASFNPPRRLQVECQRVNDQSGNPTNRFRSRYLRLVTDTVDQAANSDQCVLADWDPSEPNLEILDQVARVEYRCDDGSRPQTQVSIGHDRRKIRMAAHVLKSSPAGSPIVQVNDGQRRVQKWYRRTYAQSNVAPRLMAPVDAVDPPRNMLVVSNNSGANAAGNANNRMRFYIRGSASGIMYTVQGTDNFPRICLDHDIGHWATLWNNPRNEQLRNRRGNDPTRIRAGDQIFVAASGGRVPVVYRPPRGSTPIRTAQELARRVQTAGYRPDAFPNQPRPGDPRGSADLLIKEASGALVTLENEESNDSAQTLTVARVNTSSLKVSSNNTSGGYSSHNIGSPEQRALVRNYRAANNRVECFVAGQVAYDDNPAHLIRGRAATPKQFRPAAERPQDPFVRSTFMASSTMSATTNGAAGDSSDQNPFTFPHESGHVIIDTWHASETHQLMKSGTSGTNAVNGSKRIYDTPVTFTHMTGVSPFNQITRLRSSGAPVLESWSSP